MALTAKKVYAILKRQISDMEAKLNSPVRYRGTVATADLLPLNPDIGDMYNIESKSVYGEAGMNVAWNGVVWDTMGAPIDMSLYIKSSELADWVKQQNKPTYTADEVGALPDTTVIPSKTSELQNDSGFLTKIPDNYLSGTDKTLSASGKAADAKATGDKITELSADISNKLNKNQGSENSGKIAGINESGDIVPMFPVSVDYNEETNCLEFGSDQKMELNKGINLDSTLTKTGYAADAGAVGEITNSLKEDIVDIASDIRKLQFTDGGHYIAPDGSVATTGDPAFKASYLIPIPKCDKLIINNTGWKGDVKEAIAFYNGIGETIKVIKGTELHDGSSYLKEKEFDMSTIPNCSFIKFSYSTYYKDTVAKYGDIFVRFVGYIGHLAKSEITRVEIAEKTIDLDKVNLNSILVFGFATYKKTNKVPVDGFNGCVYTMGRTDNVQDFKSQLAIGGIGDGTPRVYFRYYHTQWSPWSYCIDYNNNKNDNFSNPLCIFDSITCIGDSLTWGMVYTDANKNFRRAKNPYPVVLQKLCPGSYDTIAVAGYSPSKWWKNFKDKITEKNNQLFIIYLGTNGGLTDTIDTDANGNNIGNYNVETNTGAYCAIVNKVISVGGRALLVKTYHPDDGGITNSVIMKIGDKFGVSVVDNPQLDRKFSVYPDNSGTDPTHYNDIGYVKFATQLLANISNMSQKNIARLLPLN